jgi:hypothetical protein
MQRPIVLFMFVIAIVLGLSGSKVSVISPAGASTPTAATATTAATARPEPSYDPCLPSTPTVEGDVTTTPVPWDSAIDVRPPSDSAALLKPRDVTGDQDLYLVVWTLPPGTCIPFSAEGNKKDGAVILMVEQGTIEFIAEPYEGDTAVTVSWGTATSSGEELGFSSSQVLGPGDWVMMDDQVWFSYTNVGDENAIVYKAVWADLGDDEGCGGSCK